MFKFKRNEKKNRKVLRKLIKIGLILALIFWLLCMLLDLLNGWNMELDKLARLVNEQSQTINSLQYELDTKLRTHQIGDCFAEPVVIKLI
jgi:amino acid permease